MRALDPQVPLEAARQAVAYRPGKAARRHTDIDWEMFSSIDFSKESWSTIYCYVEGYFSGTGVFDSDVVLARMPSWSHHESCDVTGWCDSHEAYPTHQLIKGLTNMADWAREDCLVHGPKSDEVTASIEQTCSCIDASAWAIKSVKLARLCEDGHPFLSSLCFMLSYLGYPVHARAVAERHPNKSMLVSPLLDAAKKHSHYITIEPESVAVVARGLTGMRMGKCNGLD